jgi:chromate transporter
VSAPGTLGALARIFLRLGATSFGGPAAHIALMESELVRKRGWLTHAEFLDLLSAANLIPGPNSTELAIHIGLRRGGWPGLIVAGACFILPAALIVTAMAWAYVRFGALPQVTGILNGVQPVVIAVVVHALWMLGRTAIRTPWLAAVAAASVAALAGGLHELTVLALAALVSAASSLRRWEAAAVMVLQAGPIAVPAAAAVPFSMLTMFLVLLKIGAVLFGSGYVLLAFLRGDFVERLGWLTEHQLLDAVAVGQVTPGPVFTTATFVGYILGGGAGAAVGTLAIFLPAFVFVALSGPLVPRLRSSAAAGAMLDGVNAASLALMAVVTWQLATVTLTSALPIVVCLACLVLLARYRINPTWLVIGGAGAGLLTSWIG